MLVVTQLVNNKNENGYEGFEERENGNDVFFFFPLRYKVGTNKTTKIN